MEEKIETTGTETTPKSSEQGSFDYSFVHSTARIATYDDLRSAPRITEIPPASTTQFIEDLASTIYNQSQQAGGAIPYTVIREVSENFIHAKFSEIIVSILDKGNTIRFADQGPGIQDKKKVQLPGFTSAVEPMKHYIRGVGSGLPIVKEYLDISHGSISIDDNLGTGSVVTISLTDKTQSIAFGNDTQLQQPTQTAQTTRKLPTIPLNDREKKFLTIFLSEGALGISEMAELSDTISSTTYNTMKKLTELGLIEMVPHQKKRMLTDLGYAVTQDL